MPMVNAVQIFEPDKFVSALSSMTEAQLYRFVATAGASASVTRHVRTISEETIRRDERFDLAFTYNKLARSHFVREIDWARYVTANLPSVEELAAQRRFATAAVSVGAEREAVTGLISYLARVLNTGGGNATPERVSGIVDTICDYQDNRTIYGTILTGFSVPIIQVAARNILENSKWLPAPAEMLGECQKARRFFWEVSFAAERQASLVHEAAAALTASPTPERGIDADEIEF